MISRPKIVERRKSETSTDTITNLKASCEGPARKIVQLFVQPTRRKFEWMKKGREIFIRW